jgi:hypothetical protein
MLRPIVKDAFKVSELRHQFFDIDIADGYLQGGTEAEVMAQVNEKYDDAYLLGEAANRLDIAMDPYNQDEPEWRKDANQLRRFIKRWSK